MDIEFVLLHEASVVFLTDFLRDFLAWKSDAEVEVAEIDLNVMILDLIVLVLSASITDIAHLFNLLQLLCSFLDVPVGSPSCQVAVHEHKCGVLEAKSDQDCSLITSLVADRRLHC